MDVSKRINYRNCVVESIERDLVGPADGECEIVKGRVFNRYLSGILFPANLASSEVGESDDSEVEDTKDEEGGNDNSLSMAYEALPASMGISFFVKKSKKLVVRARAGVYSKQSMEEQEVSDDESGQSELWKRTPLGSADCPGTVELEVPPQGCGSKHHKPIFGGWAKIHALFRPKDDGHLVTVTMINPNNAEEGRNSDEYAMATLFQCRFQVSVEEGSIGAYPTVQRLSLHEEDELLRFVHRKRRTFGIGHGCAATWDTAAVEKVSELVASPLPRFEVRGLTNDIDMPREAFSGLNLRWLADPSRRREDYSRTFKAFVSAYRQWIKEQRTQAEALEGSIRKTALEIVERQEGAAQRMETGVECLAADGYNPNFDAFKFAQQAMLLQFLWSGAALKGPFDVGAAVIESIDPTSITLEDSPKWRPFQLAFQLMTLESLANEMSTERGTMDLLWFPTGGGKTEAYLALTAFEIARRRLVWGESGGGTSVWMRYTLRLLTSQQFERCAKLVSVIETMRRSGEHSFLGSEPVTLGLWVGADTAPNYLDSDNDRSPGARQLYDRMINESDPQNRFQLTSCPRCGTYIVPRHQSPILSHYGIEVNSHSFKMFCPNTKCDLHERIPVSVVDEDLYRRPPTVLIGTIDKFARMVWVPESRAMLGYGLIEVDGRKVDVMPPSLVIQDELHLINGPLGTIAGVYEAALDTAIRKKGLQRGPKYLAATATIQRAFEQVKALYGRDVLVFPPTGLDVEDSFYSKEDTSEPGRLYVGAMNNGLYSTIFMLVQASGACAQAVKRLDQGPQNDRDDALAIDSYWTQVVYHNSRQELGKTTTMLRDDVGVRLGILEPNESIRRPFDNIEELSANLKGGEVRKALDNLAVSWPDQSAIDALPCTNMISVGVDVSRLGLMIVKGQPKSTAEYIQASSRVGRDRNRPPGIVLTLFSATRPRDRSHFETFQSYHQALYRLVEPVSVTPFASPALDRTLHAALVLAVRQTLGWTESRDAGRFKPAETDVQSTIQILRERLKHAYLPGQDTEIIEVLKRLEDLIEIWARYAEKYPTRLRFEQLRQFPHLMVRHPATRNGIEPPWPTLNSMRHVDGETRIEVRGELQQ